MLLTCHELALTETTKHEIKRGCYDPKLWSWNVTGHKLRRSNYFEVFFSFQRGHHNPTTAMAAVW